MNARSIEDVGPSQKEYKFDPNTFVKGGVLGWLCSKQIRSTVCNIVIEAEDYFWRVSSWSQIHQKTKAMTSVTLFPHVWWFILELCFFYLGTLLISTTKQKSKEIGFKFSPFVRKLWLNFFLTKKGNFWGGSSPKSNSQRQFILYIFYASP